MRKVFGELNFQYFCQNKMSHRNFHWVTLSCIRRRKHLCLHKPSNNGFYLCSPVFVTLLPQAKVQFFSLNMHTHISQRIHEYIAFGIRFVATGFFPSVILFHFSYCWLRLLRIFLLCKEICQTTELGLNAMKLSFLIRCLIQ